MKTLLVAERSFMAEAAIRALRVHGHDIVEIWTLHKLERMLGRSPLRLLTPSPRCTGTQVHKHDIKVRQIKSDQRRDLNGLLGKIEPVEMLVCAGSHLIFPKSFLDLFPNKAFNLHPALLPHYRGPLPRLAMVFDGALDQFGGITLHCLSEGIDEGAIIAQRHLPRSNYRNFMAWDMAIADACHDVIGNEMNAFLSSSLTPVPQNRELGSYHSLKTQDAFITDQWSFEKLSNFMDQFYGYLGNTIVLIPNTENATIAIPICETPNRLGSPSGARPIVTSTTVEIDILDARVRLKRATKWVRLTDRLGRFRTLMLGK